MRAHTSGPTAPGGTLHIPLDGAAAARLHYTAGAQDIDLMADTAIDDLCHARFAGSPPFLSVRAGTIRVHYPRILGWPSRSGHAALRLNASVPWEIEIHGGAQQVTADLRPGRLTGLAIHGGASHVTLKLPPPRGVVSLTFAKGVHQLRILRPPGAAARLSVHGGTSNAQLDNQILGAVGGLLHWQTPDYPEASDRYDISVGRGASGITLASSG